MAITRRFFIGGAASFGALAGCRAFNAPAGLCRSGAKLRIGIVSDIHVDAARGDFKKFGDTETLEHALRYFAERGADGVMIVGDMADNGLKNQLQCVADAWNRVFPGNRAADGRPVEKLFVYGNHDVEGQDYDHFSTRYFEKSSLEAMKICNDPKRAWEEIFDEEYAPVWKKTVKGYDFIGAHWVQGHWEGIAPVRDWFAKNAKSLDPKAPFFFCQHLHPRGTCHLGHAWGEEGEKTAYAREALNAFPNAVAFSGHSHTPLTDPSAIWQGEFTSIGTSSLRYGGGEYPMVCPTGYENGKTPKSDGFDQKAVDAAKLMGDEEREYAGWRTRQGMLMSVFDDQIVFERRDFINDESLGDDWVVPLGDSRPFTPEANRALKAVPAFPCGAELAVEEGVRKNRKGEETSAVIVSFPSAQADALGRPRDYEIVCEQEGREVFRRYLIDKGYSFSRRRASKTLHAVLPKSIFPTGTVSVRVIPRTVNDVKGDALVVERSFT